DGDQVAVDVRLGYDPADREESELGRLPGNVGDPAQGHLIRWDPASDKEHRRPGGETEPALRVRAGFRTYGTIYLGVGAVRGHNHARRIGAVIRDECVAIFGADGGYQFRRFDRAPFHAINPSK